MTLILYVILTLTPSTNGHCGQEVRAASYRPARIEVAGFRLDESGDFVNRKSIKFPEPKQDWGVIEGFCLTDSRGKVLVVGSLAQDKRVSAGDARPVLDVKIPADAWRFQ